jgi:hypothetical protein
MSGVFLVLSTSHLLGFLLGFFSSTFLILWRERLSDFHLTLGMSYKIASGFSGGV